MDNSNAAIDVQQLDKIYRDGWLGRRSIQALKSVTLQVGRGEIFGLLGPNGAGKTTFVKVMLGTVGKSAGRASLLGHPAGCRASRKCIGYLPENLRIPRHHNAWSALRLYGQLSGMPISQVNQAGKKLLESVGLADRARDSVKKYSKGMLQRLGLAIALLHDPELIFLDEPTDGLDPIGRADVRRILQQLKAEGRTIFLNSHLLQEVEMVCDRVAILDHGLLRGVGTVEQLVPQEFQGIELLLDLEGEPTAIDTALAAWQVTSIPTESSEPRRVQIRLKDQEQVDSCIDALRRQRVSIVGLARRRLTLEAAFLEVLKNGHETDTKCQNAQTVEHLE